MEIQRFLQWAIGLSLIVIACPICGGCEPSGQSLPDGARHPAVGTKLKGLSLQPLTQEGADLTGDDLQGKVTLINYWGPWCGYCEVEFPHLVELHNHFATNSDFQMLSVSVSGGPGADQNMKGSTAEFLTRQQAKFPAYRDADLVSRRQLVEDAQLSDGFGYPTTVVLDRQGVIRGLWLGYMSGMELQMRRVLETQLDASRTATK